jgi:hypothetical protein
MRFRGGCGVRSSGRGLWSAAVAAAVAGAGAYLILVGALWASATPGCTRGMSSVGPVVLVNGHLTGDATPDTQVCLPRVSRVSPRSVPPSPGSASDAIRPAR